MRRDYHIHPVVVTKPEAFPAFVEQAKAKGIGEICITDHMPLSISKAKDRTPAGMVRQYCTRVRELAQEYGEGITIKCGIEIDFHPEFVGEIEDVLGEGEFDYILGSSHMHLFEKDTLRYTKNDFAKMALENLGLAAESGMFHAAAHFDMYRFPYTKPEKYPFAPSEYNWEAHQGLIVDVLQAIGSRDMLLEINPHLAEHSGCLADIYPQEPIAQMALERNIRFCYGSDAHTPKSVGVLLEELEAHPVYGEALRRWETEGFTK